MQTADIIVIGGGIAGASAAWFLSDLGRVILLEAEDRPGYHSTGRSAALLTESYGPALIGKLVRASRRFIEQPPEGFCEAPLLSPRCVMSLGDAGEEDAMRAETAAMRAAGIQIELISPTEAARIVPVLNLDRWTSASLDTASGDLDVDALHQGYLRGAKAKGMHLAVRARVSAVKRSGAAWTCTTPVGDFSAGIIVNAAGAWADEVGSLAGEPRIGLQPKQRTAFNFDPPAGVDCRDWPLFGDRAGTFYVRPDAGRLMGSPADETPVPPHDAQPEELDVAIGVDAIMTATTMEIRRLTHRWAGLRSFVASGHPVVSPGAQEGYYWLAGQGGYGIETSASLGETIRELIAHDRLPQGLTDLGITRDDLAARPVTA